MLWPTLSFERVQSRMETSRGRRSKLILVEFIKVKMVGNQIKNTIISLALLLTTVVVGEGVLRYGIYWPILIVCLDETWIFWAALVASLLISVFNGVTVGWAGLLLLLILGLVALFGGSANEKLRVVVISVVCNAVFDKLMGFQWSLMEMVVVAVSAILVTNYYQRLDIIRIRYR